MATALAIAAVKRAKVVEAVAQGATYDDAAKIAGYANRGGAFKAFWRAVEQREAEAVDNHRALELARLDALQVPLWEKAMNGDVKAAGMVLKIIEQRSRLLGLDKGDGVQAAQTVVMNPAEVAAWKETQRGKPEIGDVA